MQTIIQIYNPPPSGAKMDLSANSLTLRSYTPSLRTLILRSRRHKELRNLVPHLESSVITPLGVTTLNYTGFQGWQSPTLQEVGFHLWLGMELEKKEVEDMVMCFTNRQRFPHVQRIRILGTIKVTLPGAWQGLVSTMREPGILLDCNDDVV